MAVLILGLVLFLGVHSVPMVGGLRSALLTRLGENGYKGLFSVVSLVGLVLIVWGFARAPFEPVYDPVGFGRPVAHAVMPFVFILLAAANMPGHIRRVLRHPMLIGVLLWAIVHLLNNGDMRSLWLFGAFGVYAVIDMFSEISRGKTLIGQKPAKGTMDLAAVVGGLVVFYLVARFHDVLFGVPVMG
ncbi:NnrU family protein [Marinobacteraceae bacterium S3BR75-40.1]